VARGSFRLGWSRIRVGASVIFFPLKGRNPLKSPDSAEWILGKESKGKEIQAQKQGKENNGKRSQAKAHQATNIDSSLKRKKKSFPCARF
jgi:hypothetical protein